MKFKSNIEAQAKVFIGDLASANATRFPNALSVTSIVPSGVQHNESLYIGLMAEALSVGTTWASGIYGAGYTNASGSGRGTGVTGEGHVGTATDTGVAVGVRGYATDTHTGNYNIGLYGDAENGDPGLTYGGNVALFLANGNIVTSSAANKNWFLGGNLAFNGQGASKIISATNGAKFDFGGTSSQLVGGDGSIISAGSGITISGGIISAPGGGYVPYTGATGNVNLGSYSITATSLIKAGGTADQYLKADGSVSTAMNSRVEVNFIATSGQTTFTTPYEVGQVEVYYNGSKLYPDEFVATNSTTIVLVTPATLNAQISIVKFVSSFNTTSIRTETVFTTTGGQTTFSVNYAIGQVDVFYNGSKLSPAEFTATNGTSVVLGFACAAGESIVIDSYVNQISGASGTTDFVSKFTGPASLGNSQIYDNGTYVGINNINPTEVLDVTGAINVSSAIRSSGEIMLRRSGNELRLGSGVSNDYTVFYAGGVERAKITNFGDIEIGGTATTALAKAYIRNTDSSFTIYSTNGGNTTKDFVLQSGGSVGAPSITLKAGGNLLVGTTTDSGYKIDVNGTSRFTSVQTGSSGVLHPTTNTGTNASPSYENLISYTSSSVGVSQILGSNYLGSSYGTGLQFRVNSEYYANDPISAVTIRGLGANAAVGIGNTAPTSKLDITNGDIKLSDLYKIGWKYSVNDSNMYSYINVSYDGGSTDSGINYRSGQWTGGDITAHNFYTWWGGAWEQRLKISNAGYVYMPSVYNTASGAGANVGINSAGLLYRSTSSLKYKKNVEDYDKGLNEIMQMRPVTYNSINESEEGNLYAGLIAEEIHDLGLNEFVQYADDGTPDALAYSNMVALLIKGIQEQQAQIKELQDELVLLKNK